LFSLDVEFDNLGKNKEKDIGNFNQGTKSCTFWSSLEKRVQKLECKFHQNKKYNPHVSFAFRWAAGCVAARLKPIKLKVGLLRIIIIIIPGKRRGACCWRSRKVRGRRSRPFRPSGRGTAALPLVYWSSRSN